MSDNNINTNDFDFNGGVTIRPTFPNAAAANDRSAPYQLVHRYGSNQEIRETVVQFALQADAQNAADTANATVTNPDAEWYEVATY